MQPSIFLEPAFFAGFAACFVLMAVALLLFLLFAPIHPADAERDAIRRAPRPDAHPHITRAARGRASKSAGRHWTGHHSSHKAGETADRGLH